MSIIIAPSRMEPVRIEDPSSDLLRKADDIRILVRRLSEEAAHPRIDELRHAMAVASAWHSSRLEKRICNPAAVFRSLSGAADSSAVVREVAGLARLHIKINHDADQGTLCDPSTIDWLKEMHADFCASSDVLCRLGRVGDLRDRDVVVGDHTPPPCDRVEAFLAHFCKRFRMDWLKGDATQVLALASAHHRLSWIHPFEDGNGRVLRLHGHAFAQRTGMAAGGLWSLPRALALGVPGRSSYHEMMSVADRPRQGDRDGRGNLSLMALESFVQWFLEAVRLEVHRALKEVRSLEERAPPAGCWPEYLPSLFSIEG